MVRSARETETRTGVVPVEVPRALRKRARMVLLISRVEEVQLVELAMVANPSISKRSPSRTTKVPKQLRYKLDPKDYGAQPAPPGAVRDPQGST